MTGAARIAAFVVALGAAFGTALALGSAVGSSEPDAAGGADEDHGAAADEPHAGHAAADAGHGRAAPRQAAGLAVAEHALRLSAERTTLSPGREQQFSFRIVRRDGSPLRDFDVVHERRMHLIVVRRDLTHFQHLHPRLHSDGTWTVNVPAAVPGAYRAFADFSTAGRQTTLGVDLFVPGDWQPVPLPPSPGASGYAADYAVELLPGERTAGRGTELRFDVRGRDRRPAAVAPYLGARGHLVILREGALAYLHNHAERDELAFSTTFPSAGRYRAFLQFSAGGSVRTAAFTLEVDE